MLDATEQLRRYGEAVENVSIAGSAGWDELGAQPRSRRWTWPTAAAAFLLVGIAAALFGSWSNDSGDTGAAVEREFATATTTVGEQPESSASGSYIGENYETVEDLVRLSTAVIDGTIEDVRRGEVGGPPDDLIQPRIVTVKVNRVLAGELEADTVEMVDGYWNAGPDHFGAYSQDESRFGQPGERAFMFLTTGDGDYWYLFRPATRFFIDRGKLVRNTPDRDNPVIEELANLAPEKFTKRIDSAEKQETSTEDTTSPN